MLRKILYIFGIILVILMTLLIMFLKNNNIKSSSLKYNDVVTFKVQYDISLKDDNILPDDIVINNELTTEENFIQKNQLFYLFDYFKIINSDNFKQEKIITLLPKENVELIRISRFLVNDIFFTSRGVSINNAKKSVLIFLDTNKTYAMCMKELKKIYVGNDFNRIFFNEAIPRLLF